MDNAAANVEKTLNEPQNLVPNAGDTVDDAVNDVGDTAGGAVDDLGDDGGRPARALSQRLVLGPPRGVAQPGSAHRSGR